MEGKVLDLFVEVDYMKRLSPDAALDWIDSSAKSNQPGTQ